MTTISNSEIGTYQRCPKRFHFERILRLVPRQMPEPLALGTFGHSLVEAGMRSLMENPDNFELAQEAVNAELLNAPDMSFMKIYRSVLYFLNMTIENGYRPVAIEEKLKVPVADGLEFGFQPDLIMEFTKGLSRGSLGVIDYKFTGQYWNDRETNMFIQGFKYAAYWNEVYGTNLRHVGIAMFNTRAKADDTGTKLFLLKWPTLTKQTLENVKIENEYMLKQLKPYFDNPDEQVFPRTVNKMECKLCPFADDACPMELAGKDITKVLERNYTHNTYGYEEALDTTR